MEFRRRRLLPLSDNTVVNCTVHDLRKIEDLILKLREQNDQLSKKSGNKVSSGPTEEAEAPFPVADALEVIQWAVGNLPPEMHKGWPHEALSRVAAYLKEHGDRVEGMTLGITLAQFSNEAAEIEEYRAQREKVAREVLAIDPDEG